jgi:hypothetical protein
MRILSDFKCGCGKVFEDLIDRDLKQAKCECGEMAWKMPNAFAYFKINGFREDLHTEQWAKSREQNSKRANN